MDYGFLKDKVVLVTGGTGSFGQRFVEKLLELGICKKIVVFSRDEFKQHEMRMRLKDPDNLRFLLGDVRDLQRLERAFAGVDVVVHAAALKQVPALEYNPLEAIKTNVLGTQNIIDAALDANVWKVLLISSDKAVNPINLYGATKLCAEKLFVAANSYRHATTAPPSFSAVRYGNVVGSRGSVVETLNSQKSVGIVTLTNEDMTRFWITLDEGVELVLGALEAMRGGEIFIPKLKAMKVKDLIAASAPNCVIKVIGTRPGEKLHEVLLTEDEVRRTRDIGKYYLVEPAHDWWVGDGFKSFNYLPDGFQYASNQVGVLGKEDFLSLLS